MNDNSADRHAAGKIIYGFHPVLARLRQDPAGIFEIYLDLTRRDALARDLVHRPDNGVKLAQVEADRLTRLVGKTARAPGVVARVKPVALTHSLDEVLENIQGPPLWFVLDGVTDRTTSAPSCARPTPSAPTPSSREGQRRRHQRHGGKGRLGAAETVPYIMVTNLARTIEDLKEHNIWVIAADMDGEQPLSASTPIPHRLGARRRGRRHPPSGSSRAATRSRASHRRHGGKASMSRCRRRLCLYETVRQVRTR